MTTSIPRPTKPARTERAPTKRAPTKRAPTKPAPTEPAPTEPSPLTRRSGGPAALVTVRRLFAAETGNYFLLLGTTLFLVVFGLVMVLSSSTISSYNDSRDFFSIFQRQGIFALIGVPLMLIAARTPMAFWKRWAGTLLVMGCALQALVVATPMGRSVGGNRNWLDIGTVSFQPSEIIKIAIALWIAFIMSSRVQRLDNIRDLAMPLGLGVAVAIGLVLAGGDLGTALILVAVVLGSLYFSGVKLWILAIPLVVAAIIGPAVAFSSASRAARTQAFIDGCSTSNDYIGSCWQTVHGWWALAAGGIFGAGLGNSKAKWSWLPEADNDFIFAIIGEELGLIGAITVLVLFIVMAVAFVRIIRSSADPFARIAVGAIMIWIVGQAFVNIAVVLGLLPVLGVPLPLISSGGSALVTSLVAIGIVLSFARRAPTS